MVNYPHLMAYPPQLQDEAAQLATCQSAVATRSKPQRPHRNSFSASLSNNKTSQLETKSVPVLRKPPQVASAANIRSRFLHKLGISRSHPLPPDASTATRTNSDSDFSSTVMDDDSSQQSDLSLQGCQICSRNVHFDERVAVYPIPSRYNYSPKTKVRIWSSPGEMDENIARNRVEFLAEDWDWRNVVEEDSMYRYGAEYIHPIHFELDRDLKHRLERAHHRERQRHYYR